MTERNITPEEFDYLTSTENLQAWAHLPLLARCIMFHRKFPDRWIRRQTLGTIMRKAGLRKKRVTVRNVPQRKTQRIEEFEDKTIKLDDFVKQIQEQKGHLVFADECIFKARGF